MGLDISIYTKEQHEADQKYYAAYDIEEDAAREEAIDVARKERESIPQEDNDPVSDFYPEHYMNKRYLRSSYNDSGFNQVVPRITGDPQATFDGIFANVPWNIENEEDDDGYPGGGLGPDALPALDAAMQKAKEIADKLRSCPPYDVRFSSKNPFLQAADGAQSPEAALRVALEEIDRFSNSDSSFGNFSNRNGEFFLSSPLRVVAIIPGVQWSGEGMYTVYETESEDPEENYYYQAAIITMEFIQELIDIINRDQYVYVSWSG